MIIKLLTGENYLLKVITISLLTNGKIDKLISIVKQLLCEFIRNVKKSLTIC